MKTLICEYVQNTHMLFTLNNVNCHLLGFFFVLFLGVCVITFSHS